MAESVDARDSKSLVLRHIRVRVSSRVLVVAQQHGGQWSAIQSQLGTELATGSTVSPMSFDLSDFSLIDMLQCGRGLRQSAEQASSVTEAAQSIVEYLYAECGHPDAARSCALIRFYKTFSMRELESNLQAFARKQLGDVAPFASMKVLTLLATIGQQQEWCDPRQSVGHRAIPLPSTQIVEEAPMIAQLIREMGLDISVVVSPDVSLLQESVGRSYNVFHVEQALGSRYIPAQSEFVERYGVRSVLGFGGLLADGNLFAVIMFSRGPIPATSAARFRNIALDVKSVIHPFTVGVSTSRTVGRGESSETTGEVE